MSKFTTELVKPESPKLRRNYQTISYFSKLADYEKRRSTDLLETIEKLNKNIAEMRCDYEYMYEEYHKMREKVAELTKKCFDYENTIDFIKSAHEIEIQKWKPI